MWNRSIAIFLALLAAAPPGFAQNAPVEVMPLFISQLSERLSGYTVVDAGSGLVHVRAPSGGQVDIQVPQTGCEPVKPEVCAKIRANYFGRFLAPLNAKTLELRLSVSAPGLDDVSLLDGMPGPWRMPAFGPFQQECFKGPEGNAPPVTHWDEILSGLPMTEIVKLCTEAVRARSAGTDVKGLASHATPTAGLREDNAAAYTLFPDLWAAFAQELGGALMIAVPDNETVIYARGDGGEIKERLTILARGTQAVSRTRTLSTDAFLWTPAGWKLATEHAAADRVLAGLRAEFPELKTMIVDSSSIFFAMPGQMPETVRFFHVEASCRTTPSTCDAEVANYVSKSLIPVLRRRSQAKP
jgi:hypothetical protein